MDLLQEAALKSTLVETVKHNYQFNERDALAMKDLAALMASRADDFVDEFYDYIFNFEHANAFLKNEEIIKLHNEKMKLWFRDLFSGNYAEPYFASLKQISETHSRIGLSTHYINASINFVRRFLLGTLVTHHRLEYLDVVEKIIDINLDVLTSAYIQEDTKRMIQTIKMIKKALDTSSMQPYYQPIVANESGAVVKYECLVRIVEADGTVVAPGDFLPIAKQVKIYPDITRAVLLYAFSHYSQLQVPFSVNLSIDDIEDAETTSLIMQLLNEQPLIGKQLTFEILESEQIDNYELVCDFIQQVKMFGVKIAIDDFGSGFSNFEQITKMAVDYLKIDGSLIRELPDNRESRLAVESIVDLATKLGIATVAEFVSSKEVYQAVKEIGVTYSQGYFFGKPEPLRE